MVFSNKKKPESKKNDNKKEYSFGKKIVRLYCSAVVPRNALVAAKKYTKRNKLK